jgi:hypothetical protein
MDDCVSDETWSALAATRGEVELIELLALIGFYRMNASMLNSLGVQPEPWSPRLGEMPSITVASPPPSPAAVGNEQHHRSNPPPSRRVRGRWNLADRFPSYSRRPEFHARDRHSNGTSPA